MYSFIPPTVIVTPHFHFEKCVGVPQNPNVNNVLSGLSLVVNFGGKAIRDQNHYFGFLPGEFDTTEINRIKVHFWFVGKRTSLSNHG